MSNHRYDIRLRPGALDKLKADHEIETDGELADLLHVSKPMLSLVRSGRRGVGPTFIAGMLVAFGITVDLDPDSIYEIAKVTP